MAATHFSPAEERVLTAVERHKSQKEAARALGLSPRTVEAHLRNVRKRLDVTTTREAIALWRGKEAA